RCFPCLLALLACLEERVEERTALDEARVARVHEFRMPLHADDEAMAFPADRLDEPIRVAHRLDHEPLAERLHRLVMDRVAMPELRARIELREPRVGKDANVVEVVLVLRLHAMLGLLRALRLDVLVESAPERDVDD